MLLVARPALARGGRRLETALVAALFLMPLFAGLLLFHWVPLLVALRNSLMKFSPLNPDAATFVGFDNYVGLLANSRFQRAGANTLIYIAGKLVVQIPLGLGLALLVNQSRLGARITRGAVFAALVASEAIVTLIWNILYNPDNGLFNSQLARVGIPKQLFLTSPIEALPAILTMIVWKDVGFTMLLLLAGLQTIPQEFHEAAAIDGADGWARLWFITVPLLRRMLLLATFMATIAGARIFTPILLMTEGGPQDSTVNLIYYMYEQAFRYQRMGEASATAIMVILLLVAITLAQGRLLRTSYEY
jgi:ABC-type sugar transport system permease subunit